MDVPPAMTGQIHHLDGPKACREKLVRAVTPGRIDALATRILPSGKVVAPDPPDDSHNRLGHEFSVSEVIETIPGFPASSPVFKRDSVMAVPNAAIGE